LKQRAYHTGTILFRVMMLSLVVSILCFVAPMLQALYVLMVLIFLLTVILFTFGLILLDKEKVAWIQRTFDHLSDMKPNLELIYKILQVTLPIIIVLSVVVIVCQLLASKRSLGKIIASAITGLVAVALWICVSKGVIG